MRTFTDNADRTWAIAVDINAVRRVRTALSLNLVNSDFSDTLQKLLADPVLLCDTIYVICKPDADRLGVTDIDFGRAMAGDAIEKATSALLDELANFIPNPRDRARVQTLIKLLKQYAEKSRDVAEIKMEGLEQRLISGLTSGESPAPSE